MAIVDDIRRDRRTKNVLEQTNTKTVSVPNVNTGLIGDLQPDSVFTVADFDLVKNQVHLEEDNFQLMEALNTMGRLTNMQSQSGPILGTIEYKANSGITGSGLYQTIHRPNPGEVWQFMATDMVLTNPTGSVNVRIVYRDAASDNVVIIGAQSKTATGEFQMEGLGAPLYYTYDMYIQGWAQGTFDSTIFRSAVCRVR